MKWGRSGGWDTSNEGDIWHDNLEIDWKESKKVKIWGIKGLKSKIEEKFRKVKPKSYFNEEPGKFTDL